MSSNDTQTLTISLDKGEYLETHKRKAASQPNFYKVGRGNMNKKGIQSIDLIQEITNMTKAEQLVILTIKDSLTWDNDTGEVYIKLSKVFDKTKGNVFLKGFKLLKTKNLVARTKTSHYMINPCALVPRDYVKGQELWDSLTTQ